ncbi:MAG: protein-tyrosine-phosphatase [Sphaerobacter sp.]|nr:protein-tyrosine-phosphatase [Sphaerobacter sp.]
MRATAPTASGWPELVDLHSHVLPGVDDGARDLDQALRMLRLAEADGVRTIAATPHASEAAPQQIHAGVAQLNRLAADAGLRLRVVPGSEVRLAADLAERAGAGHLVTLAGTRYLLLELPLWGGWPPFLLDAVYHCQVAGLWPILAHAERYRPVQRDPGLILDLIDRGVLVQLNGDSLFGRNGREARWAAEELLRCHAAHLIASDAHDADARPPRIRAALERAAALAGTDYARWMAHAAAGVLQGQPIQIPKAAVPRRGSRLGWLRWR